MSELKSSLLEFMVFNESGQLIFHMDFQEVLGMVDSKKNLFMLAPELSKSSNDFTKRMENDKDFRNRMYSLKIFGVI